ncbi:NlpC/P60 family protein [uncultured Dubosiella sp.]|nr:NlpC/P60 family protein [uncultured Dubosiella sp.]
MQNTSKDGYTIDGNGVVTDAPAVEDTEVPAETTTETTTPQETPTQPEVSQPVETPEVEQPVETPEVEQPVETPVQPEEQQPVETPVEPVQPEQPPVEAPVEPVVPEQPPVVDTGKGQAIANAALAQVGMTQDCTMLATNALAAVGINFHGWPEDYAALGSWTSSPVAGDLIIYSGHIAVYIGNGQAVHGGWLGSQTVVAGIDCERALIGFIHVA